MNLDDLLFRYFGTSDMSLVPPRAQVAGIERIEVDFALETDLGNRFALWALLHLFGSAPDLDVAFKDEKDRNAARNFMDLLSAADEACLFPLLLSITPDLALHRIVGPI